MNKFLTCALAFFTMVTISACGKSSDEKAQDRAEDNVNEFNMLGPQIVALGKPSAKWSNEELDNYEAKLNRYEALYNALVSADGKSNIDVQFVGNPTQGIAAARSALASARAAKQNAATTTGVSANNQNNLEQLKKEIATNTKKYDALAAKINSLGEPSHTWSAEQFNELIKTNEELSSLIDVLVVQFTRSLDLNTSLTQQQRNKIHDFIGELRSLQNTIKIQNVTLNKILELKKMPDDTAKEGVKS